MDRPRGFRLGIVLAALCGASALGAEQHTVAVFGEGRVSAVPDKALVSLGVTTQAPKAEEGASHLQPRKLALEAGGGVIRPGEQAATVRLEVVYALK